MLIFSTTKEPWNGERINGLSHPRNIEQIWTVAELTAIGLEKYVAPPPPPIAPLTQPITPVQFDAMLRLSGKYTEIMTAVNALPEPAKSVALAKINRSDSYDRSDPLFAQLGAAVGLDTAALDALWLQAVGIK